MSKVMSQAAQDQHGKVLQGRIDEFAQIPDPYEVTMKAAEARGYLSGMVEFGGLPAMIAEAWENRIKKAEQAQQRRLKPRKPKEKPLTDEEIEQAMGVLFE